MLSFIAVPLMKNGFEVICPDMPLYGYTRYKQTVTYDTWVSCGTRIVQHYQSENSVPTFLLGLSAGGMLAYQIACEINSVKGLIVTCLLDQRNSLITKSTAINPILGALAKPVLAVAKKFAGDMKVPMKWLGNMNAIANNKELVTLLTQDKKSSGAKVSLSFLYSMLNPIINIEPEKFDKCPVLLVHPGDDHWTDIKLSNLFYERLACEKQRVILDGAGHFPIEHLGLKQMEIACLEFMGRQIDVFQK